MEYLICPFAPETWIGCLTEYRVTGWFIYIVVVGGILGWVIDIFSDSEEVRELKKIRKLLENDDNGN